MSIPSLASDARYIRNNDSDVVIIFVHGFDGDGDSTWRNGSVYWPTLIATDSVFDRADIYVYEYPTGLNPSLSIDEIAGNMLVTLANDKVTDRKHMVFVSHSMGGIITRALLLNNHDLASKIMFLQFYSTPGEGSGFASVLNLVRRSVSPILDNVQLDELNSNTQHDYLGNQQRNWSSSLLHSIPSYCAYETKPVYGLGTVVSFESATALCTGDLVAIDENHINIVKPKNTSSMSYQVFKLNYENNVKSLMDNAKKNNNNRVFVEGNLNGSFARNLMVNDSNKPMIGFRNFGTVGNENISENLLIGNIAGIEENYGYIGNRNATGNIVDARIRERK